MMRKYLHQSYRVITLKKEAPRGHGVLLICIDLFNTRHPPCNPELSKRERVVLNQTHRLLTRDKLMHLVRFLTDHIVDKLSKLHTWDRFQTTDADDFLDVFNNENVDTLIRMVYRKYPQNRALAPSELCATEESRMAGVVAHLMDLVPLAESDLLRSMPHNRKLLTP